MKTFDFMELAGSGDLRDTPMSVTIGTFDGLHRGHMEVIRSAVKSAKELSAESMLITFSRNPKRNDDLKPIITPELRDEILEREGIDNLVIIDFSENISKLSGVAFISLLRKVCRVEKITVGSDFRCGNPREALGVAALGSLFADRVLAVVPDVKDAQTGIQISSTAIREALQKGEVGAACSFLGRPYTVLLPKPLAQDGKRRVFALKDFEVLLPPQGAFIAGRAGAGENGVLSIEGGFVVFESDDTESLRTELFKEKK